MTFDRLSEADSVKEDKEFINQYSGAASDLSDRLVRSAKNGYGWLGGALLTKPGSACWRKH